MPSEAAKYLEYARECIRLAGHAVEAGERDKLVELARTWMQAAMTEEEAAAASSAKASSAKASSAKASSAKASSAKASSARASSVKASPDDPQPRV
jgi:hypothetical protein